MPCAPPFTELIHQHLARHCQVVGVDRDVGVAGCGVVLIGIVSVSYGKADDVVPGGESVRHFSAVGTGAQPVASGTKVR